ncbi:kinase-like domain-containing protein [Xylaria cf. heliscus]|nr:kinase-like domain-containing protein [Xylaria cf. heliscus]
MSGLQWLELQSDTGKICFDLSYTHLEKNMCLVDKTGFRRLSSSGTVLQVTKKDIRRQYAQKTIRTTQDISLFMEPRVICHPFIAPLVFASRSSNLQLYTPLASDGHLFDYLQRLRRFDIAQSRFYTAEIVCALQCLHDGHNIGSWLKPSNILLDSVGHVTLCGFDLFKSQSKGHSHL